MSIEGKGFFIWKVRDCEGGDPAKIVAAAKASGFTNVLIKIADGQYAYNTDRKSNVDFLPPVVDALKKAGISVWGWHYVYGYNPAAEAVLAVKRTTELALDGYVIDAEIEYTQPGRINAARAFMDRIRRGLPNLPMALSSYRFPSYHPRLPWKEFLDKVDYNMPQVYWEKAHNPEPQLKRTVREFEAKTPFRPVIPTGPAYQVGGWKPTVEDTNQFFESAKTLNLKGANFFSWDECRRDLPAIWDAVGTYIWNKPAALPDIVDDYFSALNSRDPKKIDSLYLPDAVHITFVKAVQGSEALRSWYTNLFTQVLPESSFKLTSVSGKGNSRHFTWTAQSTKGQVNNGSDTIGLLDGKIAYHYSYFHVSR
ncbi:MAG: nuclear transport factor 2 family protein [Bellilinea sp.]